MQSFFSVEIISNKDTKYVLLLFCNYWISAV